MGALKDSGDEKARGGAGTGNGGSARDRGREPLSRDLVLQAAVALADREGIGALTMRRLAAEVDYEVMSLYHHVSNKAEVLDGMIEIVAAEVVLPGPDVPWSQALRDSAMGMRTVLVRHPWAVPLWSSRLPGPRRIRLMEAQLDALARSGIDPDLAHVGFHALLNHVLGYALQEQSLVIEGDPRQVAEAFMSELPAGEFPHLIAHIRVHLDEPADDDFGFVIDLILDRLAKGL